jgi:hypothetical protein
VSDELLPHIMDLKESVGRLHGEVAGIKDHIVSVSRKTDTVWDDLEIHAKDPDAHPQASKAAVSQWAAIVASVAAAWATLQTWAAHK